jgi:FkbM family methyltransferase
LKLVGSWWLPDGERHLATHFAQVDSEYQKAHRKLALKHVTNFHTAIDIGAHIGTWSRGLAERFERVLAFEPVPEHRECFRKNVIASNVTLYPFALGEREAEVGMVVGTKNSGHSFVSGEGQEGQTVMRPLDSFGHRNIGYIKADCEGYEVFALKGAEETILRCKPIISVEQKPSDFGPQYAARDYLRTLGMKEIDRAVDDLIFGW